MKKRIITADDEPITIMDLREILEATGYNVVGEASDGFDAVALCRKHSPDLVLMDIKMPLLTLTGDVDAVKVAVEAGAKNAIDKGILVEKVVIPSPSKKLLQYLL